MTKLAYTVPEVVQQLGIGRAKLYLEIKAGRIHPRKNGKRTIFLAAELERYLNALPLASNRAA